MNRDLVRSYHIRDACIAIIGYLSEGEKDTKTFQAIERNMEIIGEASRVISNELKEKYPNIPWGDIVGFRNILAHEYFTVSEPIVWDIAENKIPALRDLIEVIIKDLSNN